jgi:hypothetical protein
VEQIIPISTYGNFALEDCFVRVERAEGCIVDKTAKDTAILRKIRERNPGAL